MDNQSIGILDSGIGGLTIWRQVQQLLPNESIVYLADSLYCPYGERTPAQIHTLARRLIKFMLKQNVKLIVIACNTITVSSLTNLRKEFTTVPIIGITPVVKRAVEKTRNKRIGILSTLVTSQSEYHTSLIEQYAKDYIVINRGTDKLVPLIQEGRLDGIEEVLKKQLKPFIEAEVDTLVLGCSHFPLVKNHISKIMGENVQILDSAGAVSRHVARVLHSNGIASSGMPQYSFYTTKDRAQFERIIHALIGDKISSTIHEVTL